MKKLMLAALSSLAMGAYAADDHKFYAGGGASLWNIEMEGAAYGSGQLNVSALEGTFGYEVLPWLSVEGRLGTGIERDREDLLSGFYNQVLDDEEGTVSFTEDVTDTKAEIDYYASFYLKPQLRNDVATLYGLVGVTSYGFSFTENSTTYSGTYEFDNDGEVVVTDLDTVSSTGLQERDDSEATFSMGVGVGFYFNKRFVFNIEYKNLIQSAPIGDTDATIKTNGVTAAVNYSF